MSKPVLALLRVTVGLTLVAASFLLGFSPAMAGDCMQQIRRILTSRVEQGSLDVARASSALRSMGYSEQVTRKIVRSRPDVAKLVLDNPSLGKPRTLIRGTSGAAREFNPKYQNTYYNGHTFFADSLRDSVQFVDFMAGKGKTAPSGFTFIRVQAPEFMIHRYEGKPWPCLIYSEVPDLTPFVDAIADVEQFGLARGSRERWVPYIRNDDELRWQPYP